MVVADPVDRGQFSPIQGPGIPADIECVSLRQPRTEPTDSFSTKLLTPEIIPSTRCLLQGSPATLGRASYET